MKLNANVAKLIKEGKYLEAIENFKKEDYREAVYLALKINRKDIAIDICLDNRDFNFIKYIQQLTGQSYT